MATNNFENGAESGSKRDYSDGRSPFRNDVSFSSEDFWAAHNAHHGAGSNENLPNISISDNQNGGTSDSNQSSSQNSLPQELNSFLQEFEQFFQQFQQGGTGDSSATNNSPSSGDSSSSNGDTTSNSGQSDNSQPQRHQPTDSTQPSQGGCAGDQPQQGSGDSTQQNSGNSGGGTDSGTSGTSQSNGGSDTTQTGSGSDSTQSSTSGQSGSDCPTPTPAPNPTPTPPATPTIADQAASVVSQVDNSAQSGDFLGALTTLNNSEQAFKSSDPNDYNEYSQDLLSGIEHTNTSDGKTGADVMNALTEADIAYNWSALSKPDGDHAYMDPQDLLNDVAASSDPVNKALLANGAANFGSLYGLGTVQNADVANDMQLNEASFAQTWTKSF